jgi:8-oxo-dGTP pyrophosphatase MutT (NUDIX family)
MFEMKSAKGNEGGWRVIVDGEEKPCGHLALVHDKYGKIEWGQRPEGFAGWVFHEPGGGGSVTIPFAKNPEGEIFLGLIRENRANMGGPNWCVVGGYIDPGETHQTTAERETQEEAGLVSSPMALPGLPGCINRATWVADPSKDEGVHAYGIEIPWALLERAEDEGHRMVAGTLNHTKEAEMRFFPWKDAIQRSPNMLARGAIAQLLAELL